MVENVEYIPCDYDPSRYPGSIQVDASRIQFDDNTFDLILLSHVLDCIEDDIKAISEIYRVLNRGGIAVIAVPIYGQTTFEVPGLDPRQRMVMYGDMGHVRLNGLDFSRKLADACFSVEILNTLDVPGNYVDRSVRSPHTESDNYAFLCTK